ncbi:hypothetical protein LDENG_00114030 [Lucifuga dentata]|nr:hypothetical protein LDENG_00114030 [Lucifuga dentata]
MFLAIRHASRDVEKLGFQMRKSVLIQQQSINTEWKLAKIAFVVIIVFVLSWSPYTCVTLIAWAGYGSILNPYSKAFPAVIAKASTIYNPFIYAIVHSKYRDTLAEKVPCLHFLAQAPRKVCISVSNSESSFKDTMLSRQSSGYKAKFHRVSFIPTADTKVWSDVELDPIDQQSHCLGSSCSLRPLRKKEHKSLVIQTRKKGSQNQEQVSTPEHGSLNGCDHNLLSESVHMAVNVSPILTMEEENAKSKEEEREDDLEEEVKHQLTEHKEEQEEDEKKEMQALMWPDSVDCVACVYPRAIVRPKSKMDDGDNEENQSTQSGRRELPQFTEPGLHD